MRPFPFISASQSLPEITIKGFILGVLLALIMAVSNTYLALKIGVLTPSSIPAAIISMAILRLFKRSNILENNQVQTCASAGEAIAGGVVYTAPALVIIHYWLNFNYVDTFLIALIGGTLGVLFTVPLRRVFMTERHLQFPEGKAIAEVLRMGTERVFGLKNLVLGGVFGAILTFCQSGIKLMSDTVTFFAARGTTVFGFGVGFAPTLIGAGYLMGFEVGFSVLIGAVIATGICLPVLSHLYGPLLSLHSANDLEQAIMGNNVRFIGVGAMLVAGLWTLLRLLKPFYTSLANSLGGTLRLDKAADIRTEKDIPGLYLILGTIVLFIIGYVLFSHLFPLAALGMTGFSNPVFLVTSLIYVLVIGFILSAICGYFSGLVGVTASPGSSVAIAAIMIAALIVRGVLGMLNHVTPQDLQMGAAITIVLASVVMGACCVANNNSQDLKVGHLLGATPWKQQLMLMTGGLIAALIIPVVMQLLYQAYGIAGSMPHPGMDPSLSLPAPPAAAMGAVAQGVFTQDLPWNMLGLGALIAVVFIGIRPILKYYKLDVSVIGIAIGIYLPLSSSTPLFLGALISLLVKKHIAKKKALSAEGKTEGGYPGMVMSCGLVAGAAIMSVLLAIPFALLKDPNALNILPASMGGLADGLGVIVGVALCVYLYRRAVKS